MYNFKQVEKQVFDHWQKNKIYEKAKKRVEKGKKFYFLDGPPYTSGRVHLGTAWNKSLKDCALRYKRMKGFNVWDRAGYDMHGLPIERNVEKKFKLRSKDDVPKFGVERFVNECRKFAVESMHLMNDDFKRLGVWMDFDNAYQSVKNEFIESVWWLVKKAHEKKRMYEGKLSMTWCQECATALAKHELEYKNVLDDSIFVKFRVVGTENEFLIIWTTTPWTIPFNLAVMAHPDFEYVKAKVGDEVWILAKNLTNSLVKGVAEKDYKILETFKGSELHGLKYEHPFYKILKPVYDELMQRSDKVFSVVMSDEYVDLSAGSGLVHTAPGCGPEDFEVGHREGIPAFNNLDEFGVFPDNMGKFSGFVAKRDDKKFIEELDRVGALIAVTQIEHDYAHCWRCKQPVIYRTTRQWFFKIEDLRENMRELNKDIFWVPDYAGSRNFDSWLANLRDNGITRQRYWGTPLPVWRCDDCEDYVVVGSAAELKKLGGKVPEDLHKPWIDTVELGCKCGGVKKRIPDIMDVWIDAGSTSWNCLDFPHRKDLFKRLFPADFILEGIDQIRGWFNMLFVASMISMQKPCFKAVYMHGFINDAKGRKMSKSLGNYILPEEVLDKYGADTLRYYMIGGTSPGVDINYNFDDMKVKFRNLGVLWNLHNFLVNSAKLLNVNPAKLRYSKFDLEERYMLSKLNSTIARATELFDKYELTQTPWVVEDLFLDLSRTYIQLTRDKLSLGSEKEKRLVLYTVYNVLLETLKMFAPIAPYITDKIYLNLRDAFKLKEESIHLYEWPKANKKLIDKKLEQEFEVVKTVSQKVLSGREQIGLGVRWPLAEVIVVTKDKDGVKAVKRLGDIIKKQTNVKSVILKDSFDAKLKIKADYEKLAPEFGDISAKIIAHIAMTSPETILGHIEREGKYEFSVNHARVAITRDHLIIEKQAPEGYVYVGFSKGDIFIDSVLDEGLEAEGFSRELMRRVQALRKKAGLEKRDKIELYVKTDKVLCQMFKKHKHMILDRVGASKVVVSELKPSKSFKHHKRYKVREKGFEVFLQKR